MIDGLEDIIQVFEKYEGSGEGLKELEDENLVLLYEEMMEARKQFDTQYHHILFGIVENWYEEGITFKEYIMEEIHNNYNGLDKEIHDNAKETGTFKRIEIVLGRFLEGDDISPYLFESFLEYMHYINGDLS